MDEAGQLISYEEYYPYGSTSYQAGRSAAEVSLKRYRYAGMEREEETGLAYHRARYYAPWLARWSSSDPSNFRYSRSNSYDYANLNPVRYGDTSGYAPSDWQDPDLDRAVQNWVNRASQSPKAAEVEPTIAKILEEGRRIAKEAYAAGYGDAAAENALRAAQNKADQLRQAFEDLKIGQETLLKRVESLPEAYGQQTDYQEFFSGRSLLKVGRG